MIVERARGRSTARRFPVAAPGGTRWLTGLQWETWRYATAWRHRVRGPFTLTRLSELTGSSRGRCWHALARLRQLGLIGFRAYPFMEIEPTRRPRRFSPGRHGRLLVWTPRAARTARSLRLSDPALIDSPSTPYGRYLSREGLATAATREPHRWCPPGTGGCGARAGPRRGRSAPRALWSHCPLGHRIRFQRRSWTVASAVLTWRGEGWCRHCRQGTVESIELPHPVLARPFSPAELADASLWRSRQDAAAALVAGGTVRADRADRYRIDYLDGAVPRLPAVGDRPAEMDLAPWILRRGTVECAATEPEDHR